MLIEIPRYVLDDEDPPTTTTAVRAFHLRSYQLVEPIDFPRDLFVDALGEHARLLEAHGEEILSAPLDHPGKPADERFVALEELHDYSTLLVSDGATHAVHRWRTVDLSYVVQRCRGIVLQLMEMPCEGHGYLVVVARGVASLHLVCGVAPRRAGERPRLEVVTRDLVVEPWEQWHWREGPFVTTWWQTPRRELVASRTPVRPWPSSARAVADAVLTLRAASLRQRLDAFAREHPRGKPMATLDTSVCGEEIYVLPRREPDPLVDPFPEIVEALRSGRTGLYPVVVHAYHWAALCWIAGPAATDVALPEPLVVRRTPQPDDDPGDEEEEDVSDGDGDRGAGDESGVKREPPLRMGPNERLLALFDDFPPLDPWEPRASEVHAVWRAGLLLVPFAALLVFGLATLRMDLERGAFETGLVIALVAVSLGGLVVGSQILRLRLRALDPKRRRRRWRAWKQVNDEQAAAMRPARPKPRVPGRKFWMGKLAKRLSRLERLADLDAPENIIDAERKLVRDAIAELDKGDADAVLAAWPAAVRYLEPREGRPASKNKGGGTDKPN